MIDIFKPEALIQLREYLLAIVVEGTSVTMRAVVGVSDSGHIVLPPDISNPPDVAPTDAATAPSTPPATPPAPSTPPAPATGAVADMPIALAPADTRYFQRSLWCDMRVRSNADEADKALAEFNQRWPQ